MRVAIGRRTAQTTVRRHENAAEKQPPKRARVVAIRVARRRVPVFERGESGRRTVVGWSNRRAAVCMAIVEVLGRVATFGSAAAAVSVSVAATATLGFGESGGGDNRGRGDSNRRCFGPRAIVAFSSTRCSCTLCSFRGIP